MALWLRGEMTQTHRFAHLNVVDSFHSLNVTIFFVLDTL